MQHNTPNKIRACFFPGRAAVCCWLDRLLVCDDDYGEMAAFVPGLGVAQGPKKKESRRSRSRDGQPVRARVLWQVVIQYTIARRLVKCTNTMP